MENNRENNNFKNELYLQVVNSDIIDGVPLATLACLSVDFFLLDLHSEGGVEKLVLLGFAKRGQGRVFHFTFVPFFNK